MRRCGSGYVYHFSHSKGFLGGIKGVNRKPNRFVRLSSFFVSRGRERVCVMSTSENVFMCSFSNGFGERPAEAVMRAVFNSVFGRFVVCGGRFFVLRGLPLCQRVPGSSL